MGDVRWTVKEAAQQWGVSVKRVYKWINGRSGSKGGGRRDERGSRRRLSPGIDYEVEETPRGKIFYILNSAYPAPLVGKINRPKGIPWKPKAEPVAEVRTDITPEAIIEAAQEMRERAKAAKAPAAPKAPKAPRVPEAPKAPPPPPPPPPQPAPQPSPAPTLAERTGPIVRKAGQKKMTAEETRQAAIDYEKLLASEGLTEEAGGETESEEPSGEEAGSGFDPEAFEIAQKMVSDARSFIAQQKKTSVTKITPQVAFDFLQDYAELKGVRPAEVADAIFDQVIMRRSDEPWTRDPAAVERVRAAYTAVLEQIGGESLNGLAAAFHPTLAQRAAFRRG